jgi:hypothetical protein
MSDTSTATLAQAGAGVTPKVRRPPVDEYEMRLHCLIPAPMGKALRRMKQATKPKISEAHIVRTALHSFLMAHDPQYRQEC